MITIRRRRSYVYGLAVLVLLGLSACGGGGGTATGATGVVNVSLTDAQGDFISYMVDVRSLTLTKSNGTVVETLPVTARIDFARYTDLSEFLTAATVPKGTYKKATLTLDYAQAEIWVEDADGNGVEVGTIQDSNGDAISQLEVSVSLDGPNALPITPGIPRSLVLDFDLEASNTVSFPAQDAPLLTVQPFLRAEVEKASAKVQRLRGPLQAVNTANGTFHVSIRPFYARLIYARLINGTRPFGSVRVFTNPDTFYEIDGGSYSGEAGLQALALKDRLTAVIVRGTLRFKPVRFEATEVYAGTSVPGGELDVVTGSVVDRSNDTLTLRGATLMRANATVVFNDAVSVQLAPSTTVKRQLSLDEFNIDDISVGQRLLVFGTLTDDSLDAANGNARILLSDLRGQVVTNDATPAFDLDLSRINGRSVAIYDFTGTGTDPDHDADPAHYELATSTLDVSGVNVGATVHVKGFARPFGLAPKDFDATAVAYPPTN